MRKGLLAGDVPAFVVVRAAWEQGDEPPVVGVGCVVVFLVVEGPIETACVQLCLVSTHGGQSEPSGLLRG